MEMTLIHKPAFTVIGFSKIIQKAQGGLQCPEFWNFLMEKKFKKVLETGVASDEQEQAVLDNNIGQISLTLDGGISFNYVIGGIYKGGPISKDLKLYKVPEYDWICFEEQGALPDSLVSLYDYVWGQWFPSQKEFELADTMDMGIYPALNWKDKTYKSYLCLPVKKIQ